ncbi:MAG TPA: hypothetical protein VJ623_06965 [Holophagaceae bacterium]|nr:hypothetical protein [Holophagaceae bacterium]
MSRLQRGALLGLPLLVLLGCSGSTDVRSVPPPNSGDTGTYTTADNTPAFDPAKGIVPLPNILATAAQPAFNLGTEAPTATSPLDPLKSLRYVNTIEMAGKHAVAGINAPIFMEFTRAIDPATLAAGFKIYEITPDSNGLTEANPLTFTDITALFTFKVLGADTATEGTNQVLAFPKLPLKPGTRYVYVVTSALKDSVTHLGVGRTLAFGFASQATPLVDGSGKSTVPGFLTDANAAALEGIRGNVLAAPGGPILLSGYGKTVGDLVAAGKAVNRDDVKVIGRFITTGAMATYTDPANPATLKPIDALLKAFATAGAPGNPFSNLAKNWNNTVTATAPIPAATFYTAAGAAAVPHAHVKNVVNGSFNSADLAVDPYQALAVNDLAGTDATTMNNTGTNSTYNVAFTGATGPVAYGVLVQKRSSAGTGSLLQGFYNVPRTVNFLYFEPTAPAGATVPMVIFQHGITRQKEDALTMAETACALGYGVIAIDQPMHGTLARTNLTGNSSDLLAPGVTKGALWGQDFMSLSSPLTGRTNIQQAGFNLFRLEYLMRTGAVATALGGQGVVGPTPGATGNITYVSQSLGSIVGAYFLAGTTNVNPGTGVYDAASIASSPKGFLSVPGGRIAYLLKESGSFGGAVKAGVSAGINALLTNPPYSLTPGTPAYIAAFNRNYQSTFHLLQSVVDPVDSATMGHPALTGIAGAGALSRFTGRLAIQEASSTTFDANGVATNGDLTIPNSATRYFATSFAGWNVASPVDFAPGFKQVQYATTHTATNGVVVPFMTKFSAAPAATDATGPTEGYFQFDLPGITHGFFLDWTNQPANTALAQKQLAYFLGAGGSSIVVDPTAAGF